MKTTIFALLLGSLTGLALLGCDDDEKEAPERVLTLSIVAPEFVEPELCEHTDSVEISLSARDQFDHAWNNVAVVCTLGKDFGSFFGFYVDTVFEGSTGTNGDVQFLFPVHYYAAILEIYELRAWGMGKSTIASMTIGPKNEGPLDVYISLTPDTVTMGQMPDSLLARVWFMYDHGGPEHELFTLHPEIGILADSILFLDHSLIESYWYLPESLPVGRYSIVVDYSSSACRDMSDTTWVTIIP